MILGCDFGAAFGWALIDAGRIIHSGRLTLPDGPKAHQGARYHALRQWLDTEPLRLAGGPVDVAYEQVESHTQRNRETGQTWFAVAAAHAYGGYRAIVLGWAAAHGLTVLPVGVGQWKGALGCRGGSKAPKEEVQRCVTLLGIRWTTPDEADAIGVALYADGVSRRRDLLARAGVPTTQTAFRWTKPRPRKGRNGPHPG